jgi:hypothetical protein|tara:strand:+ start:2524 stop:3390 length:867 start_codon:yes stop_codon:yes gene_type:complete
MKSGNNIYTDLNDRLKASLDYLQSLYNITDDKNSSLSEKMKALETFRSELEKIKEDFQLSPNKILTAANIEDGPFKVVLKMRRLTGDKLRADVEYARNNANKDIVKSANLAFQSMILLEKFEKNFEKNWEFCLGSGQVENLKRVFNYEATSMAIFSSLKIVPELTHKLNIEAARTLYKRMLDNPKINVMEANGEIFDHLIQAGFDDISTKSQNLGKYKHNVEVYTRVIEPDLNWEEFWQKMSKIAMDRGQLREPTSYFGPMPNANTGDWGDGDILCPSKNMRLYSALK